MASLITNMLLAIGGETMRISKIPIFVFSGRTIFSITLCNNKWNKKIVCSCVLAEGATIPSKTNLY